MEPKTITLEPTAQEKWLALKPVLVGSPKPDYMTDDQAISCLIESMYELASHRPALSGLAERHRAR